MIVTDLCARMCKDNLCVTQMKRCLRLERWRPSLKSAKSALKASLQINSEWQALPYSSWAEFAREKINAGMDYHESKHDLHNFIVSNMDWKQSHVEKVAVSQARRDSFLHCNHWTGTLFSATTHRPIIAADQRLCSALSRYLLGGDVASRQDFPYVERTPRHPSLAKFRI